MEEGTIIRQSSYAGQFYPAKASELKEMINLFLEKAALCDAKGEIVGLIVPHAGYVFSGQTAAYGFKHLQGQDVDTVILIGNSHQQSFDGVSVFTKGYYETPLGKVKIDSSLAQRIMNEDKRIFFQASVHFNEHCLEVELPFLQVVLKNFKIVPILFGNSSEKDYKVLAQAILKNIKGKNVLLLASSDFSHYPSYEDARRADSKTAEAILKGDIKKLEETVAALAQERIPNLATCACGLDSIKTVMVVAKELGADKIKLLHSSNSGDIEGFEDKDRVVGYAAIGFFGLRRGNLLNKKEQEKLLQIAKTAVETYVREGKIPKFEVDEELLTKKLGTFVTLRKNGKLRGCIGRFSPTDIPLHQVVAEMAVAAVKDARFSPVEESELDELEYEISVLSDLERVESYQDIEIRKHGVKVKRGFKSGVFLPQVAKENNWDLKQFMEDLCFKKAGLEKDCFKQKETEIYVFTAQVF